MRRARGVVRYTLATACLCVGWTILDMAEPGTAVVSSRVLDQVILLPFQPPGCPKRVRFNRSILPDGCIGCGWTPAGQPFSGCYLRPGTGGPARDHPAIRRCGGWRIGDRPGLDGVMERAFPFLVAMVGDGPDVP